MIVNYGPAIWGFHQASDPQVMPNRVGRLHGCIVHLGSSDTDSDGYEIRVKEGDFGTYYHK